MATGPDRSSLNPFAVGLGALVVAFGLRAIAHAQVADLPFLRGPIGDARAYLEWSHRIPHDWLGLREGAFYQAPLYPYLLALSRLACGEGSLVAMVWVQITTASIAIALLATVVARSSAWAGCLAGLLLATFEPAIVLDLSIGKESLASSALLVALAAILGASHHWSRYLFVGLLLGLASLLRESLLLLIPVTLVWLACHTRGRGRAVAACAAGSLLILGPLAVRNAALGGGWSPTTSQAGPNFYIGNRPGASGGYQPLRPGRGDARFERHDAQELAGAALGTEATPAEASRYWLARGIDFWRTQPLEAASLFAYKVRLTLAPATVTDVEDPRFFRDSSSLLGVLAWLGWRALIPLALVGVVVGWPTPRVRLASWWTLTIIIGVAAFFVLERYRLPLAAPAALLAAQLPMIRTAVPWRRTAAAGIAFGSFLWLGATVPPATGGLPWVNLGVSHSRTGDFAAAEASYRRALEEDPHCFEAHLNLGDLHLALARTDAARHHLEMAVALVPEDAEARQRLALARAAR